MRGIGGRGPGARRGCRRARGTRRRCKSEPGGGGRHGGVSGRAGRTSANAPAPQPHPPRHGRQPRRRRHPLQHRHPLLLLLPLLLQQLKGGTSTRRSHHCGKGGQAQWRVQQRALGASHPTHPPTHQQRCQHHGRPLRPRGGHGGTQGRPTRERGRAALAAVQGGRGGVWGRQGGTSQVLGVGWGVVTGLGGARCVKRGGGCMGARGAV